MNLDTPDGASAFLKQLDGFAPTPDQLKVIMGGGEPALVIAGAGAGKTKTMALRVVYHVAAGHVAPGEALGLTFTKKAANELSFRIAAMLRKAARLGTTALDEETAILSRPRVSTYNSFASSIASEHGLLVGVDPSSRLITDAERFQIVNDLVRAWNGPQTQVNGALSTLVKQVLSLSAEILDNQLTTDQVREAMAEFDDHLESLHYRDLKKNAAGRLFKHIDVHETRLMVLDMVDAYLEYKRVNRLTEFADQVSVAHRVLLARPQLIDEFRRQHRLVLLDEYQDTSVNQARFLAELFRGQDVTAVGDPNQAIYGWRGASADALTAFKTNFRRPDKPVAEYSLSMAFRNKGEILAVANAVAEPLRDHSKAIGLTVPPLEAFTKSGGQVDISFDVLKEDSYRTIAEDIARFRADHAAENGGRGPSIAVLCRARQSFKPMADALAALDIPFIEHGNQSAITQPEVRTVRGLLRAVVNPARGDELLRPVAYLNIAPADIEALNTLRRSMSRELGSDISIVEVLARADRANLSPTGRTRIATLAAWIKVLTDARYSRIEDLIGLAIRITGLETEVASRSVRGGIGRASLSILQRMAAGYSDAVEGATIEAFLTWLDMVEEYERGSDGGDMPLADLALQSGDVTDDELEDPHSVTIMTIHGAKGLEWDYVAIPDMRRGGFDLLTSVPRDPWIAVAGKIPLWLRADAASLPEWRWKAALDKEDLKTSFNTWDLEEMADHENREVRRLAYVAMTRPRSRLLLAGYWYLDAARGAKEVEGFRQGKEVTKGPSRLLDKLEVPVRGVSLTQFPEVHGQDEEAVVSAHWLADANRGATPAMRNAADRVAAAQPLTIDDATRAAQERSAWLRDSLADLIALLNVEEANTLEIGHVTANGVVAMANDASEYRKNLRRPIPTEPALAARLGQQVHEYIALQYSAPRAGDLLDVSGDVEQVLGLDLTDPAVVPLIEAFEGLDFVRDGARPVAIESPVDVTIAGMPLRGTIDAVFVDGIDPASGEKRVRIVDWKTGRRPGDKDLEARELQLHLYRYAWSKVTGTDPSHIRASFAYLGEKDPAKRIHDVPSMEVAELEARVAALLEEVLAV